MRICFEWEEDRFNYFELVKEYKDMNLEASIESLNHNRKYEDGYPYECCIYLSGGKIIMNTSETFDGAKQWCDEQLIENNIKTVENHYRVLI